MHAMFSRSLLLVCMLQPQVFGQNVLSKLPYKNEYGNDYGKTWIYFPDEDGKPHYVDLTEGMPLRGFFDIEYDVQFRLYTRNNVENYTLLDEYANVQDNTTIYFEKGAPVKLITHGWMSSGDKNSVINIKNEYLKKYNYNVVGVNWGETANNYMYPFVALETHGIGKVVGKFLDSLSERYGVTGNQIHLIGHSLGAHVMGNAASTSKLRVARITGLDPARPMFELPEIPNYLKLDKSDAEFVDIIHTCSAMLGIEKNVGHADFFPNNGFAPQPGCAGIQTMFEACSHSRAHFYFAESIRYSQGFPASRCSAWDDFVANKCDNQTVYMGEGVDKGSFGKFYLTTNPVRPYARNMS